MKLTVDCELNSQTLPLQNNSFLAQLLAKAKVTQIEMSLEALICEQYGLQAVPDYPMAAISAAADGLEVGDAYWLRADPVYLVLQRDCFILGESVPLLVDTTQANLMIASLNLHFSQDGLAFLIGKSGAWYLRSNKAPQIKTSLPGVAIGKNIHQFLPQGARSSKWLAVLNEVQMLLHEHPANVARESVNDAVVNSIWLSGGGLMPQAKALQNDVSLMVANSAFYQGLATLAGTPCQALPDSLDDVLQNATEHARLQLPQISYLDEVWFSQLLLALKTKKIKQLTLNLGFYEKSLIIEIKPLDNYKFWRSPIWRNQKSVMDYLK